VINLLPVVINLDIILSQSISGAACPELAPAPHLALLWYLSEALPEPPCRVHELEHSGQARINKELMHELAHLTQEHPRRYFVFPSFS
jgi:hypothetical protein